MRLNFSLILVLTFWIGLQDANETPDQLGGANEVLSTPIPLQVVNETTDQVLSTPIPLTEGRHVGDEARATIAELGMKRIGLQKELENVLALIMAAVWMQLEEERRATDEARVNITVLERKIENLHAMLKEKDEPFVGEEGPPPAGEEPGAGGVPESQ